MTDFNTSLLREKFVIRDRLNDDEVEAVTALSNRIVAPMIDRRGDIQETFVIRGHNMHTTVRLAAKLVQSFHDGGKIMYEPDFNWERVWRAVTDGFEKDYNPNCWGAVYFEGKCVFKAGEYHPFLDIIEKFDALQKDDYERSINLAEKAFQDAGKLVTIQHDTNVALVVSINPLLAKCGVILRGAGQTTTFNFTAKEYRNNKIKTSQCLSVAAAYLEGIQLAFAVGMGKRKMHHEIMEDDLERKKTYDGEKRLSRLNHAIAQFDHTHDVNYRPERPDLFKKVIDAEKFADKILKPQIKAKLEAGELDEKEWVT